ncbi:hypothetical protein GGH91_004075, partial [Coemansia sp. RSA 2671]
GGPERAGGSHELPRQRDRGHGLHMPQAQRSDWRGNSRALSMSPGPYQHSAAPGSAPRRTGLGPGGSRGGSPSRK